MKCGKEGCKAGGQIYGAVSDMPKKGGKKKAAKAAKPPVFHLCPDCEIRVEKGGCDPGNCAVGVTVNLLEYRNRCCNCGKKRGWPTSAYEMLACRFCKAHLEQATN